MCKWKIRGKVQDTKYKENGNTEKENNNTYNVSLCSRLTFSLH